MKRRTHYRSVWISDLHLGFRGCKAKQLHNFLKSIECDFLYLVGDVFDLMAMRSRIHWDAETTGVIRRILKMMKRGTRVVYITGNHDEPIRLFVPFAAGSEIAIENEIIHVTKSGKRLMVIHGDKFDFVVGHMKWLTILGSRLYDWLLSLNSILHTVRVRLGFTKYWSLSAYLKSKTKRAISFVHDFESAAMLYAEKNECCGVICGHIHTPKMYVDRGILYANCGDWVESLSALVENDEGNLELVHWHDLDDEGIHDCVENLHHAV
jgi:UDP-2,3-diacylglucosamine pyrophosphatase LpxH